MNNEKILLIDADSLMYYEMGAKSLEEATANIDKRINSMLQATGATSYAGFLTIGKCFRYSIGNNCVYNNAAYKHNRKGGDKPIIFYALKEYLQQEPYSFVALKGLEADDAVGIYAQIANKRGYIPTVCSPDKDVLLQIPGTHYNYQKAKFVKTSKADAEKFLWEQTITGDSTDGIPGIKGVGAVTVKKLLENSNSSLTSAQIAVTEYINKYGVREGITRFAETFNLVYILRSEDEGTRITALPDISSLLTSKSTPNVETSNDFANSEWT